MFPIKPRINCSVNPKQNMFSAPAFNPLLYIVLPYLFRTFPVKIFGYNETPLDFFLVGGNLKALTIFNW